VFENGDLASIIITRCCYDVVSHEIILKGLVKMKFPILRRNY